MKHAHTLTYIVGAEILSRALAGTSQAQMFSVAFYSGNNFLKGTPPKFPVLSVSYRKRPRSFFDGQSVHESGALDPHWSIAVYSVPRHIKHSIRTKLISEALPTCVVPWLSARQSLTGRIAHHTLWIEYDVNSDCLISHDAIQTEPEQT